jgi:putative nucleotidyltransferase with HDIG domain
MREELLKAVPEFERISDDALRKKALAVWLEGMQEGGWTVEDLLAMPFTLLAKKVTVTFLEHVRTVARMCIATCEILSDAYGDRVDINQDVLVAGALLADVGKLKEYERAPGGGIRFSEVYEHLRHPFTGVAMCAKHDIPFEVMHVIATHSWEGDKFERRPESLIFHHADFTDFEIAKFYDREEG